MSSILAVKDEAELNNIKKAAELTNKIFSKFLKDQLINIIDGEKVKFIHFFLIKKKQFIKISFFLLKIRK